LSGFFIGSGCTIIHQRLEARVIGAFRRFATTAAPLSQHTDFRRIRRIAVAQDFSLRMRHGADEIGAFHIVLAQLTSAMQRQIAAPILRHGDGMT
jgi:hypothetical protein